MSTYYFLPTRNVFGQGAAREAGELMKSLGGRKTMIVTDRFLGQNGMAQQIQDILTQSGVDSVIFSAAEEGIEAVKRLSRRLGIPANLKELGVRPEDFALMAENAQKDVCSLTNPRIATEDQIVDIFQDAYDGR